NRPSTRPSRNSGGEVCRRDTREAGPNQRCLDDLVFRLIHLKPEGFACAAVLVDDGAGLGGPDEGLWVLVAVLDPVDNGGLELIDAVEGAAANALAGDLSEEPLDEIDPGRGG